MSRTLGRRASVITYYHVAIASPTQQDFQRVSNPPCTVTAGSGQACPITYKFHPVGTGPRTGEITLTDGNLEFKIDMVGFGDVSLPTAPSVGATTDVLFCSPPPGSTGAVATCSTGTPVSCDGAGQLVLQSIWLPERSARTIRERRPCPSRTRGAVASGAMGPAALEVMSLTLGRSAPHRVVFDGAVVGTITRSGAGMWGLTTIPVPPAAVIFPGLGQ